MIIKYNNLELSKADNLQDLTLKLIYEKIGLFLQKPEFKSNILIPDTLRSYTELVSCFKDDDALSRFDNYLNYKINSEFDNQKVEFYKQLINSSDEFFVILILNYFADYEYLYDQSEINSQIFNAKNPYNISISDLVVGFNYIEENFNVNDYANKKFIDFLRIYTSFRILKSHDAFKVNLLFGGLINDHYSIFPSQIKDDFRRDQITFNYRKVIDNYSNYEVWLNYFVTFIGVAKSDFRLEDEKIYERRRLTKTYENATFSPLYPIVSLFCLNSALEYDLNDLVDECQDWADKNEKLKSLFLNPLFVNEFNRKLDNFSKNKIKETLGSYSEIVYQYIFTGIPYVINELKNKYPFLDFLDSESIIKNPIYQLWFNNEEEYSAIIEDVYKNNFSQSYPDDLIKIAENALERYDKYFDKNAKNTSQGTKQAMNFLIKLFVKDKEIHKEFKKYRNQMDRQFNNGLNNIHNLLNRIANG